MKNLQDESDADARLVAEAKNLQSRMLIESAADSWGNLQSRISFESDADACWRSGHGTPSTMVASAADSTNIRDCKFLALATNLASASDSLTSETAS